MGCGETKEKIQCKILVLQKNIAIERKKLDRMGHSTRKGSKRGTRLSNINMNDNYGNRNDDKSTTFLNRPFNKKSSAPPGYTEEDGPNCEKKGKKEDYFTYLLYNGNGIVSPETQNINNNNELENINLKKKYHLKNNAPKLNLAEGNEINEGDDQEQIEFMNELKKQLQIESDDGKGKKKKKKPKQPVKNDDDDDEDDEI